VLVLAVLEVLDRTGSDDGADRDAPGPLAYHDRRWHVLGDASERN
jgi:hypothetical protein